MKRVALLAAVLSVLTLAPIAAAETSGRFVGTPSCTGDTSGNVTCTGRVAGLTDRVSFVFVWFHTVWACTSNPTITIVGDGGMFGPEGPVQNGELFTITSSSRDPLFYEVIFQTDFGCTSGEWTLLRYTDVTLQLWPNIDVTYEVGTIYPT
jgi:hypothetical protein